MAEKEHTYRVGLKWTGNDGSGTSSYRSYRRDHVIEVTGKPVVVASSDPSFRGDAARYNPEELLVASLSSCHMLSYLHLCAVNSIVVTAYEDSAIGTMAETKDGGGRFTRVDLHPKVTIAAGGDAIRAQELHHEAHRVCFIANSVNFPVGTEPQVVQESS